MGNLRFTLSDTYAVETPQTIRESHLQRAAVKAGVE